MSLLDQAGKADVDDLLARGEAIRAMKRVREVTGLRLIDAKRLVESLRAENMAAGRPWWQMTKTARQGFMFGTVWAVLGIGNLLEVLTGRSSAWHWVIPIGTLALAGAYLVSAVALRRRERSDSEAKPRNQPGFPPSS